MTEFIFHRASTEDGKPCAPFFYFIELPEGKDTPSDIAEHVRRNPGTLKVETILGEVIYENEAA